MKRLDENDIPDLQCDQCLIKITPKIYIQEFGVTKFDYTHSCCVWLTMEQLPPKELK